MLGRTYGHTMFKLLPAIGYFPTMPMPRFASGMDFAATDAGAIFYTEDHPSAKMAALRSLEMVAFQSRKEIMI